jgi:uncharacterized repeat protein (TIGR01451 family)
MKKPSRNLTKGAGMVLLSVAIGLTFIWLANAALAQSGNFDESYKIGLRYAYQGDVITYTIVTVNSGGPAQGVVLAEQVPHGAEFVLGSCTYRSASMAPQPCGPLTELWQLDLAAGARVTTTLAMRVTGGSMSWPMVNRASLSQQIVPFTTTINPDFISFIPLIVKDSVQAPDLVVQSVSATANDIQVVIANQGNQAVTDEFWVAVYIDPNPAPTAVNQLWYDLGQEGMFWGVVSSALPLDAGETLTLRYNDTYYWPSVSRFFESLEPGTPVYAQVDAYNPGVAYGAVLEDHERLGTTYNNVGGPFFSTASVAGSPLVYEGGAPESDLPPVPTPDIEWKGDSK